MKKALLGLSLALSVLFAGCSETAALSNLTPQRLPENPSGIYRFTLSSNIDHSHIIGDSLKAEMVVNGQSIPMNSIQGSYSLYDIDFHMPPGQTEVRYFYRLTYESRDDDGIIHNHEEKSPIYDAQLVNKYVLSLGSERGPVGSTIGVIGSGFSPYDTIVLGNKEVPTHFLSPYSLQFTVPAVDGGKSYDVYLRTGTGDLMVGSFLVDASSLQVLPASLDIISGGRALLVFSIDHEAPAGGLPVTVKTDIPASVIMPEVVIPEGARSVSVQVEGGPAARGRIVAEAPGYLSATVPVVVR